MGQSTLSKMLVRGLSRAGEPLVMGRRQGGGFAG